MSENEVIPRHFHQTGATSVLAWEERTLLKRTRKILNRWDYTHWNDTDLGRLFKDHLPHLSDQFNLISKGVVKADLGRYAIMYSQGGVYIDTDYRFTRLPLELLMSACTLPVEDGRLVTSGEGVSKDFRLGNACLASSKGFTFWRDLLEDIFDSWTIDELNTYDPIITTGPVAITKFWLEHKERYASIATPEMILFYPDLTWSRLGIAKSRQTVGIHLCWGSWRTRNIVHNLKTLARRRISALL